MSCTRLVVLSVMLSSVFFNAECSLGAEREMSAGAMSKITPLEFLDRLTNFDKKCVASTSYAFTIVGSTKSWLKESDVYKLAQRLNSDKPSLSATSALSSFLPTAASTEKNEAAFLIRGFIEKQYPPSICSTYGTPDNVRLAKEWLNEHPAKKVQ